MLKIVLIPVILFAGYLVLKRVVTPFEGPSEQDLEDWKDAANRMDGELSVVVLDGTVIDTALLTERFAQWERAEQAYRSAQTLSRTGVDLENAIVRLKQSLLLAPNNQEAQELLLKLYLRTDAHSEVLPLCLRLLDQDSQRWDLKLVLLDTFFVLEKLDVALLLANEMLQAQPSCLEALEVVAYVNTVLGNTDEALGQYVRILDQQNDHALALSSVAHLYQQQGKWSQAIIYYVKMINKEPSSEVYRALAQCHARLEQSAEAVVYMGQAISLYGQAAVNTWLDGDEFDAIRDTIEFRSLTGKVTRGGSASTRDKEPSSEGVSPDASKSK